jgi:hypothetical protein
MSDLRDRIAAALKKADETVFITDPFAAPEPSYSELADAVIAELGLHLETGQRSNPTGPLWGSNNRHTVHRYITDWKDS